MFLLTEVKLTKILTSRHYLKFALYIILVLISGFEYSELLMFDTKFANDVFIRQHGFDTGEDL